VKDWKKIYQVNSPPKQAEVAILISEKVDFKLTLVKQDQEGHFILIKGTILQKEITIINLCAPNVCQCTLLHETYTKGLKSTYGLQHSGSGKL
jgi:hypothetical protein